MKPASAIRSTSASSRACSAPRRTGSCPSLPGEEVGATGTPSASRQMPGRGPPACPRSPARPHRRNRRARGVDERGHVGAAAGNQDRDAASLRHCGSRTNPRRRSTCRLCRATVQPRAAFFDPADLEDASRPHLRAQRVTSSRLVGGNDHRHADAAIEGPRHLLRRDAAALLKQREDARQMPSRPHRSTAWQFSGRTRGIFSRSPPPVICARPLIRRCWTSGRRART